MLSIFLIEANCVTFSIRRELSTRTCGPLNSEFLHLIMHLDRIMREAPKQVSMRRCVSQPFSEVLHTHHNIWMDCSAKRDGRRNDMQPSVRATQTRHDAEISSCGTAYASIHLDEQMTVIVVSALIPISANVSWAKSRRK